MKKIIAAAAIASVGASAAYYLLDTTKPSSSLAALAYIPADTVMFTGQLKPFPLKQYVTNFKNNFANTADVEAIVSEMAESPKSVPQFIAALLNDYLKALETPDLFTSRFGFAEQVTGVFYLQGLLPVIRYEVVNEKALISTLTAAAEKAQVESKVNTLGDVQYHSYTLHKDDEGTFELVVAIHNQWATITFNTPFNTQQALKQALAIEMPKHSLASENTIDKLITQHQLDGNHVGFLNHIALVNGLTSADDNQMSSMLTKILTITGSHHLDMLRTKNCHQDLGSIANNWPRTIAGTRHMAIENQTVDVDMLMVIENKQLAFLQSLARIRGYIPEYILSNDNSLLNFGFGINVDQITPFITQAWTDFNAQTYRCEPLVAMQVSARENNPMMLGMVTGMAQGVKGVSLSIQDLAIGLKGEQPELKNLDAIVTLSAANPENLFNGVKGFYPPLANVQLPKDGSAVDLKSILAIDDEINANPLLALKGSHLVLYTGAKSAELAGTLAKASIENNGFTQFKVDYGKLLEPITTVADAMGEALPVDIYNLKEANMNIRFSMDYTDEGIEFNSVMKTANK